MNIETIEAQRERILGQMRAIRNAHPGGVSEQMVKGTRKDAPEAVERGPYYSLQWYEQGKPRRQRLRSPEDVRRAREQTDNSRRIHELAERFCELTQQLGELERDREAAGGRQKKGL